MTKTARFVSILFHPSLILICVIATLLFIHPYYSTSFLLNQRLYILASFVLMLFLVPLASMYIMKNGGIIQSFELKSREERNFPYLFTTAVIGIIAFQVRHIFPGLLFKFLAGSAAITLSLYTINHYIKISAHAAGMAGSTSLLLYLLHIEKNIELWWLIPSIFVITGLVLWARLRLNAHSVKEVYLGLIVGFFIMSVSLMLL